MHKLMKWSILFLYLFGSCFCFGALTINFSSFSDSNTYIKNMGAKYSLINGVDEYAVSGRKYETPSQEIYSFSLNADWDYQAYRTPFIFVQYNFNQTIKADYVRLGTGIGYLPDDCRNSENLPYRHKFSGAVVYETNRGFFISWRYKFDAVVDKLEMKAVMFMIGHGDSVDFKVKYKLSKNVYINYIYAYERLDLMKDSRNSLGIEIKI